MTASQVARRARLCEWALACALGLGCEGEYRQLPLSLRADAGPRNESQVVPAALGNEADGTFLADGSCLTNPCANNGECAADGSCVCPAGYSGARCEINDNDCLQNECRNGSACVDEDESYRCECLYGYSGVHCEINIDDCAGSPCENGGTCVDGWLATRVSVPTASRGWTASG